MYIQKAKRFHYNSLERSVEVAGDSVKGDSFKVLKCPASAAAASVVSAFGSSVPSTAARLWGIG